LYRAAVYKTPGRYGEGHHNRAFVRGAWDAEHGRLRELDELQGALRLMISEAA
jgi:hypothetical protein